MSDETPEVMAEAQRRLNARMAKNRARLELLSGGRPSKAAELAPELAFDDIWAPEPEANLVIPGWGIGPGPVHLVTGTWYTGKTLLLATMGLCVASGRPLFDLWNVRQGKWTHFDHEMGKRQLKRYVQRLQRGLGIDPESLRGQISMRVLPKLNLTTRNAVDMYTELLSGCSIATIDPLRAAAPGADENKSEFREHLDMLSIVGDRTGCSIIVLHHGGKPVEGAERRNTGRGTSAIDDAVQSKLVLTAKEKGAPMQVSHEKSRELSKPLDDFYLEFVNTEDSVRLVHRLPEELEQAMSQRDAGKVQRNLERIAATFLERGGRLEVSKESIQRLVRMRAEDFKEAWAHGEARGCLTRSGSQHKPVWAWSTGS